MHRAEFGSAVSPIMTMPHFALILEITPLKLPTHYQEMSYIKYEVDFLPLFYVESM